MKPERLHCPENDTGHRWQVVTSMTRNEPGLPTLVRFVCECGAECWKDHRGRIVRYTAGETLN